MSESRMIMLPKESKILADASISIANLRPITVMNAGWRLWFSAFLRTDSVVAWIKQIIPEEFAFGNNLPTEQIVCDLLEKFQQDKFLLSLDYSKAYDRLHPEVCGRLASQVFCNMFGGVSPAGFIGVPKFARPFETPSFASRWPSWTAYHVLVGFVWLDGCTSIICAHVCPTLTIVPLSPTILLSWLTLLELGPSGPSPLGFVRTLIKLLRLQKVFVTMKSWLTSCLVPSPPLLVCLVSLFLALQFGAILTRRLRALRLVWERFGWLLVSACLVTDLLMLLECLPSASCLMVGSPAG